MGKFIDLAGKQFSKLLVVSRGPDYIRPCDGYTQIRWWCKCDCGKEDLILVAGSSLRSGHTTSCGCDKGRKISEAHSKTNNIDVTSEDYAIGYTTKGEPFWFDKEYVDEVSKYCWYYQGNGYVAAHNKESGGVILLHRLIMGFPDPKLYDVNHKQHPPRKEHKVDNRKQNLEVVTHSENMMNSHLNTKSTTGIKGVSFDKSKNKYETHITVNNKKICLGYFNIENLEDAIKTRKDAELKYFGEHRFDANN